MSGSDGYGFVQIGRHDLEEYVLPDTKTTMHATMPLPSFGSLYADPTTITITPHHTDTSR